MLKPVSITDFLPLKDTIPLIDVRTPAEFAHGHVPGAFNLPLFPNEERVQVGTTYKQVGREAAILLGFDLTGAKWSGFIKQALALAAGKKVGVHCWRGGMRSGAMAWALGPVNPNVRHGILYFVTKPSRRGGRTVLKIHSREHPCLQPRAQCAQ